MSQKPKHESVSTIRYYWSRFLFARRFIAEVHAPPDEVARMIDAIEEKDEWLKSRSQLSRITHQGDDVYAFTAYVRRRIRLNTGPVRPNSAIVKGRILYSKGYGSTVISGEIQLGWLYYAMSIFAFVWIVFWVLAFSLNSASLSFTSSWQFLLIGNVGLIFCAWNLKQVYDDYHLLTDQLQQIVNNADPVPIDNESPYTG